MHHFLRDWKQVSGQMQKAQLLLFLDFDGTLAPIVKHPDNARLPTDVQASLVSLARRPACRVAIVSGRALKDIRRRVSLRGIIYVGNHGLEIQGPGIVRKNILPGRYRKTHAQVIRNLQRHLNRIPGVVVEDKGVTLSIHYRMVAPAAMRMFKQAFTAIVQPFLAQGEVCLRKGKKVYELRPPVCWDKGKAVSWLLQTAPQTFRGRNTLAIYIGDDDTDEDVFRVLKHKVLTIRVGQSRRSAAQYYVSNTAEVATLLARVVQLRKENVYEI